MRVQYAVALISCNKYRQINYQLPNEAISRSMTLPRALALCAVSPKTKLDGREIDRSKPLLASGNADHALILAARTNTHSITSSAIEVIKGGIVKPSALAVFPLIKNSNLVGCSTGKSDGLAPFKILAT